MTRLLRLDDDLRVLVNVRRAHLQEHVQKRHRAQQIVRQRLQQKKEKGVDK